MSTFHSIVRAGFLSMEIDPAFRRRVYTTNAAVVSLLLSLLLHPASSFPETHPLRPAVDEINDSGPFVGLVMAYSAESDALRSSGEFIPSTHFPWIDLYGRRFHIGSIRDVNVINVMSGRRRLNAGITVQILLDIFCVRGIVHYGTAGSASDSMWFGDVSIPKYVAFTGSWTWTKFDSETKMANMLSFGNYNAPTAGKNLLSSVVFKSEELFVEGKPMAEVFWLQMESQWYHIAKQLKVELQRCANESFCLPEAPKVVFGLKASTADVFVDNAAYRQFLFNEFGVSTVDQESSAVVQTAMAAGVPVIVFRGVSDLAGGEASWSSSFLGDIACTNALKVALEFIGILGKRQTLSSS